MHKRISIRWIIALSLFIPFSLWAVAQNNYSTGFLLIENPISEGGNWLNGPAPWAGMQTFSDSGGHHIGGTNTNPSCNGGNPNGCNDSHAALAGTWTTNQAACGTVYIAAGANRSSGHYEIEQHLRKTITAGNSTGYEFNYSLNTTGPYMQIVRWDGVVGGNITFTQIDTGPSPAPPVLNNGDTFCASAIGSTLKSWLVRGGVVQTTTNATSATYSGGAPGLGTFNAGIAADNANFGFSQWQAANLASATANQSDVATVVSGPLHTLVDGESVLIPPGSATWNSAGITVPAGVGAQIFGYGLPNGSPSLFTPSASCLGNVNITLTGVTAFRATPGATAATTRISCMNLPYGSGGSIGFSILGTCSGSTCPNMRIDNLNFPNWANHTSGGISFGINAEGNMFGVMDHNQVIGQAGAFLALVEFSLAQFLSPSSNYGDNSWAQPPNYGSANFLFIENNTFSTAGSSENEGSAGTLVNEGGGRIVVRFNQYTNMDNFNFAMGWHGTESNGRPRSTSFFEFYKNNWTVTSGTPEMAGARGGTGLDWGNTASAAGGGLSTLFGLSTYRAGGNPNNSWGPCDGTSIYDTNDGVTYATGITIQSIAGNTITVTPNPGWTVNQWAPVGANVGAPFSIHDVTNGNTGAEIATSTANTLTVNAALVGGPGSYIPVVGHSITILRATACIDQAGGRGQGTLYTGTNGAGNATPLQAASQVVSPIYVWMNIMNVSPGSGLVSSRSARTIADRDWYTDSVNQTAQTSATAPFNGATGIGHSTGYGLKIRRPATCTTGVAYWATDEASWNTTLPVNTSGNLYLCTSTNTWTLSYTPQNYPHFLVTGAAQPTGPTVSFSPTSINFGSVNLGVTSAPQTITITNTGTANLTWATYSTSQPGNTTFADTHTGSCAIANPTGLAPNASCTVTLTGETNNAGIQNGTFNFPSNAPSSPQTVPLSITGINPTVPGVGIAPASGSFGTSTTPIVFTITSNGTANLIMGTPPITFGGANPDFNVSGGGGACTGGQSISPGNSCTATVTFHPGAVGPRTGNMNVNDNVAGSPQVIPLTGTGIATASVNPLSLVFGNVIVNQSQNQSVTLQNTGNVALTITSIVMTGATFSQMNNCAASLGVGLSCTVLVTFSPVATGTGAGTLTITDNSSTGSTQVVTATGNGILVPVVATGVVLQCTVQ